MTRSLYAIIFLGLFFQVAQAVDQVDQVKKGDVLFDEPLPHKKNERGFAHGSMKVIKDGGVTGETDPKYDGHAANYAIKIDHENAIYQFETKITGSSTGGIRVGYHLASCVIAADRISIDKEKTPVTLAKDKWHLVTVTRIGTHVTMRVGKAVVQGDNAKLKPTIDSIRLTVKGADGSASYRNLKIWKAVKTESQ